MLQPGTALKLNFVVNTLSIKNSTLFMYLFFTRVICGQLQWLIRNLLVILRERGWCAGNLHFHRFQFRGASRFVHKVTEHLFKSKDK